MQKKLGIAVIAIILFIAAVFILVNRFNGKDEKTELLVSAAVSLKDSLQALEAIYEQNNDGIDLVFNYGSSGTLQQQIEQGAPADLFLSAGNKQMQELVSKNLVGGDKVFVKNELVIVVPKDAGSSWRDMTELNDGKLAKIAVGQPESVPAGAYAQEALKSAGLWDGLQNKLVFAKDVRQVLTYVESGNADAGFVYRTDALTSENVSIALAVPPEAHQPIVYPAGVVSGSKHPAEAGKFFDFLFGEEAATVFAKYGFVQP